MVSAMFVLLMNGLILHQPSNIIRGGETNYIMATVTLYVAIFNLFTSLLHLLGFMNGNDYFDQDGSFEFECSLGPNHCIS